MVSSQTQKTPSLEFQSVSGGVDDSFVGIKFDGNSVIVFHPECYSINKEPSTSYEKTTQKNEILALLKTITIAKTASFEHSKAYNTQNDGGDFALFSYLWMINDFLANGFYVNREKTYKTNQNGKISWKRTLQTDPIVSDNNIVFPNIIVEKKSDIDNIIVEVHRLCVKKSIDYIGWLFNLNSDFIVVPRLTNSLKKAYLNAVQQELDHTFLDSKRLLLNHMKNVLNGLDERSNSKEFVYGVDSYFYIFERMIDSIFGNVDHMSDFYPSSKWQLVRNHFKEHEGSKLRPDTIILQENEDGKYTAFILDSKFYRFGYTGDEADLPETTSIQKQITYGEYIKKNTKFPVVDVFSAFLMPYDKTRDVFKSDTNIQYIGFAKSTWKNNTISHELIHSFLIDLKHVIQTWNDSNHDKDVTCLVEEIVKNQGKAEELIKTQSGNHASL